MPIYSSGDPRQINTRDLFDTCTCAVTVATEHFKHAFNNPEFQSSIKGYPESTTASPHLFKKVAVSGHAQRLTRESLNMCLAFTES